MLFRKNKCRYSNRRPPVSQADALPPDHGTPPYLDKFKAAQAQPNSLSKLEIQYSKDVQHAIKSGKLKI